MFNFTNLIEINDGNYVKFKKEIEEGNVEYKLRLDLKNDFSLKKMKNQMNWRFNEGKEMYGKRECHYILGLFDNGELGGLTLEELDITINIFNSIISNNNYDKYFTSIKYIEKKNYNDKWIAFISLNQLLEKKIPELNVGFIGTKQSGKTSTIANIVYGQLDDGNGSSRQHIFKHEHEKISGFTSCIKKEIIGIKNKTIINYNTGINVSWEHIANLSDKILCLIDMPGSKQYIKTILFGLSAYNFDALIIFNNKYDEDNFNKLYIEYAEFLHIPYILVEIDELFSPSSLISSNVNDILNINNIFSNDENYISQEIKYKCNVHTISNIKQNGIKSIITFLIEKVEKKYNNIDYIKNNIFMITDMVLIPDTGIVYSGEMMYGELKLYDNIYLTNGNITFNLDIQSIHKKQTFAENLSTNEMGAIMLSGINNNVQKYGKNMIITTEQIQSYSQLILETNIEILQKYQNCEILIYVNNIFCSGTLKEILQHNKYVISLKKNIVIVPRNINFAFIKFSNNIMITKLII